MSDSPLVFVSYSHKDAEWLEELRGHLGPMLRGGVFRLWDDTHMRGGDDWQAEIEKRLRACRVAVLLVSRHSLTSDYIDRVEMRTILERAANDGVRIYPVFVSPVALPKDHWLRRFNWRPRDGRALKTFSAENGDRDAAFVKLAEELAEVLAEPVEPPTSIEPPGPVREPPVVGSPRGEIAPAGKDGLLFEDIDDLERWLTRQKREVAVIIAARVALHVTPLLAGVMTLSSRSASDSSALLLPLLRGVAISWFSARYPSHHADVRPALAAAAASTSATTTATGRASAAAARATAAAAITASASAFIASAVLTAASADDAAASATAATRATATARASAAASASIAIWETISADAAALATGTSALALAAQPLWPRGEAREFAIELERRWTLFVRDLHARGEGWEVWTSWWKDRRDGNVSDEEKEIARLTIPEKMWEEGAKTVEGVKAVNAEIARRLAEIDARRKRLAAPPLPDEADGPTFEFGENSGLRIASPSSPSDVDDAEVSGALHDQLRSLLPRLREATHKVSNRHPDLAHVVALYADLIEVDAPALHVSKLWGAGAELFGLAEAFAGQNRDRTLTDPLEPAHLGMLTAAARLHGAFILGFPLGRKLTENADRFRLASETLATIGRPMAAILEAFGGEDDWVEEETRQFLSAIGATYHTTGWKLATSSHAAYVAVRNALLVVTRHVVKANSALATVAGGLVLSRIDPGLQATQMAISFIGEHMETITAFAAPFPELRAWFAWVIDHLDEQNGMK